MKKLIICLATVAIGYVANAATYKWGLDTDEDPFGGSSATAGTAYLVLGTVPAATTWDVTSPSTFSSSTITSAGGTILAQGSLVDGAYFNTAGVRVNGVEAEYVPSAGNYKAYMVVLTDDGQTAYVSTEKNIAVNDAVTSKNYSWYQEDFTTFTVKSGGSSDIPEPTSGLLLVLGGAMLALRRRRA